MRRKNFVTSLYELLSSMRFAVGLLTLTAIASIIGTVLNQNEPFINYQIEFGSFWFTIFAALNLYDVYHASWFLSIFLFLVVSISLCVYRQLPGMLREIRSFRSTATESSLRLMAHQATFAIAGDVSQQVNAYLTNAKYRFRRIEQGNTILWAAKKGHYQKLGYFLAHIGIVIICMGGLWDGNLGLKIQQYLGLKVAEQRSLSAAEMPSSSRLAADNSSFRATIYIPEGRSVDFAWLNAGHGAFLQALPFTLALKTFHIDYYSTGQPKLFASEVSVIDKQTGKITEGTVQVNHPLVVDGIAIYQASFGDGGSTLELQSWLLGQTASQPLTARSLTHMPFVVNNQPYQIEWGELRAINIENVAGPSDDTLLNKLTDVRHVKRAHHFRNIGPSIQFKLRDKLGQAHEYINYMLPFNDEGRYYFIAGVRNKPSAPMTFVHLPLDDEMRLDTFMRLYAALSQADHIKEVARRMADKAFAIHQRYNDQYVKFNKMIQLLLTRFQQQGLAAIEALLMQVPAEQRAMIAQTYIKILQGAAVEAMQLAQQQAKLPVIPMTPTHYRFLMDSVTAMSRLADYGAPVYFQLTSFKQVQASGFQLTRAPGQPLVYLGCLLLILGTMVMFYVRETRLWIRVSQDQALIAMSSNRKDQQLDNTFKTTLAALRAVANK